MARGRRRGAAEHRCCGGATQVGEYADANPSIRTRGAAERSIGAALLAAIWTGAALWPAAAAAQPVVRVRAESRIELRTVHEGSMTRVDGVLRDDLGNGLAGQIVVLRVRAQDPIRPITESLTTDGEGRF